MVFRNRVLRTIFRPEKEGITEGWREQHNEDKISDGASSAVHLVCKFMDFGKNVPVQKAVHNDSNTAFRPKLSHTLEGNCSAYSAVKMTLISSKPIILYNNKDNAVHCSTCHAVHRGAKWCVLLVCVMEWDCPSGFQCILCFQKLLVLNAFFEFLHFVNSGNKISIIHWKCILMFVSLTSPTLSPTLRACCASITVF